jgi:hypothetical protein
MTTVASGQAREGEVADSMRLRFNYASLFGMLLSFGTFADFSAAQVRYHSPPQGSHVLMQNQASQELPSLLVLDSGDSIDSAEAWWTQKRPELLGHWTKILGKLGPTSEDLKWFGDITQIEKVSEVQCDGYRRIELRLPIEKDFMQPHLLLVPDGAEKRKCPAVIAWTSTSPDFRMPEEWWGAWLARRGFVVLTGWSFIRNYRGGTNYSTGAQERVYERFGHWLALGKMVHDVQREVEFLKSVPQVDAKRIGFIGFSLSAKTALYVAAFAPEVKATVAVDPHLAIYGASNYHSPWYLDFEKNFDGIRTENYPVEPMRGTIWSLLDTNPLKPGFERNHHELLAMAAPRSLMIIGCSTDKETAAHSDDRQSIGYVNRAREVYRLLSMEDRFEYVPLMCGHQATAPEIDEAWQAFFLKWLKASD